MADERPPVPDDTAAASGAPIDAAPPTPISGVATGNLGTGTALDDTQRYRTEDLVGEPPIARPDEPEPPPIVESPARVDRAPVRLVATPPAPEARLRGSGGTRIVGLAAVAGAAALIVLAATALLSNHGPTPGAGQSPATFAIGADGSAPSPSSDAGSSGPGNGNGNGKGNKTHKP